MLETLDYTIRIGSTPTFLYFDSYLYSANAAHYVYLSIAKVDFAENKITGEPGEKPSKHGRDQQQQLYSHEFQVFFLRI